MARSKRDGPFVASAIAYLLVPVLLFWYTAGRCEELACIGLPVNAFLQVVTIVPLLVLWRACRRIIYPAMLTGSAIAMVVATLRKDFDFSPQFMIAAIPAGVLAGFLVGVGVEQLIPPANDRGTR